MSLPDTYQPRDPLAEDIRAKLRERDAWVAADQGRIGGGNIRTSDGSKYDEMTDDEVILRYIREERERQAYKNDRR